MKLLIILLFSQVTFASNWSAKFKTEYMNACYLDLTEHSPTKKDPRFKDLPAVNKVGVELANIMYCKCVVLGIEKVVKLSREYESFTDVNDKDSRRLLGYLSSDNGKKLGNECDKSSYKNLKEISDKYILF